MSSPEESSPKPGGSSAPLRPAGVSLTGRRVRLRAPTRDDFPVMYEWRADAEHLYLWSTLRRIPSFEEFLDELQQLLGQTNYFLIESVHSHVPFGFLYAYNSSAVDGYAFFSQYTIPKFRARAHAAEATLLFMNYMFAYFNLRKLYADVYEFNQSARESLVNGGFREEGFTPAHILYDGVHWGMSRFALYREDWLRLKTRVAPLFRPRAGDDGTNGFIHLGAALGQPRLVDRH